MGLKHDGAETPREKDEQNHDNIVAVERRLKEVEDQLKESNERISGLVNTVSGILEKSRFENQ